jgi:hypothetical protein
VATSEKGDSVHVTAINVAAGRSKGHVNQLDVLVSSKLYSLWDNDKCKPWNTSTTLQEDPVELGVYYI